jgi:hypothetical protein
LVAFKGAQYPKDLILFAVIFDIRYGVSYQDLEEIMAGCDVSVVRTTLNCLGTWYFGAIAKTVQSAQSLATKPMKTGLCCSHRALLNQQVNNRRFALIVHYFDFLRITFRHTKAKAIVAHPNCS